MKAGAGDSAFNSLLCCCSEPSTPLKTCRSRYRCCIRLTCRHGRTHIHLCRQSTSDGEQGTVAFSLELPDLTTLTYDLAVASEDATTAGCIETSRWFNAESGECDACPEGAYCPGGVFLFTTPVRLLLLSALVLKCCFCC